MVAGFYGDAVVSGGTFNGGGGDDFAHVVAAVDASPNTTFAGGGGDDCWGEIYDAYGDPVILVGGSGRLDR